MVEEMGSVEVGEEVVSEFRFVVEVVVLKKMRRRRVLMMR